MNAVAETRSIAYSADTAGDAGRIACQVICSISADRKRVAYSIAVWNDTRSDAQAYAYIPDALDLRHRKIVHSVVGAYAHFSTNVELEVERYGGLPELQLHLSGEDICFTLVVPSKSAAVSASQTEAPKLAVASLAHLKSASIEPPPSDRRDVILSAAYNARRTTVDSVRPSYETHVQRTVDDRIAHADTYKSPAAFPMLTIFAAIVAALAFVLLRPQVLQFVAPAHATASADFSISYQATGIGAVAYTVNGPDGERLAGGPLPVGSGSFAIELPKATADRAYLVRVRINGIFGTAFAERYVKVAAAPLPVQVHVPKPQPIAAPQIRSLALDRAKLVSGETLNVYYDVAATNGTVALVDAASQITYGTSTLSPSGHTAFVAPNVESERFLNVIVTARRGTATVVSRVAVTAAPPDSTTSPADATGLTSPAHDAPLVTPVVVAPKSVRSGQPIRVDVRNGVAGLLLTLTDSDGGEIAHLEIQSARGRAVFLAPKVTMPTRIRLQATYPQGSGTETIVQAIDVTPL